MNKICEILKGLNFKIFANFAILFFSLSAFSQINSCTACHENYGSLSPSHDDVACQSCHGGNEIASEKSLAHIALIPNPATLENAKSRCARCHKDQIARVATTPMQTQNPIKQNLLGEWAKQGASSDFSAEQIEKFAKDHYAKACASCHISQEKEVFINQNIAKGGGCGACHKASNLDENFLLSPFFASKNAKSAPNLSANSSANSGAHATSPNTAPKFAPKTHTRFSTAIPSQNCLACHNRSARIGFAYYGKFESEGSKAPFEQSHTLSDGRHFHDLRADIHYERAGLECVDCHTSLGVMGDKKNHANMRGAVIIACEDCHAPNFAPPNEMARNLAKTNPNIPDSALIAYTKKGNFPLYNVAKVGEKAVLTRKKDGAKFEISALKHPAHEPLHANLSCQACHEKSVASCFGCHEQRFAGAKQFEWQKGEYSEGAWSEMRSFLRFEDPALGVRNDGKIANLAPGCQVVASIYENGATKQFDALSLASWAQHSVSKSKTCVSCHFSPSSLGLGRGVLGYKNGEISFSPNLANFGELNFALDAFASPKGAQNQIISKNDSTLNLTQMKKILDAYACAICHDRYDDKIYADFNASKAKFRAGETKCLE